jgi:glutathione peroxidase
MLSARIKTPLLLAAVAAALGSLALISSAPQAAQKKGNKVPAVLNFTVDDIQGQPVPLARYQGQVLLIVNVASYCGNTPQYASLQGLYEKYQKRGFSVLGFPANEFGKQEPGTNQEIQQFCSTKYRVSFPMFSKIVVKGEGQAPLYRLLTDKKAYPATGGDIEWNFAKFLISRKGEVVARFPAGKDPGSPEVVQAIEKELAAPREGEKSASRP